MSRALGAGVLVFLLVLLAGCGPNSAAGSGTAPTSTAAGPRVLRIWYATDDPTEQVWSQTLARRFEASHPGVHVSLSAYGLDDLNTKMQLALGAGNPPDLVYTTPRGPGLPAYVQAGKLRDLARAAAARGWAAQLRPGLLAGYNALLSSNNPTGAHVYAVPYHMAVVAVLYNKALFRRLGLAVPHTVAAMEGIINRVQHAGLVPLGMGNADGWVGDDWWSALTNAAAGPVAVRPELHLSPRFTFLSPGVRWAATTLQRWADAGYFTHDFGGLDAQDGVNAFFEGKTAMQLISSTENSQILAASRSTRLDVGVFAFPSVAAGTPPVMPMSGYAGWAIPTASRQPALALDFIDQVISASTARLLLDHGLLPARRIDPRTMRPSAPFQRDYFDALTTATPAVYLDGAPVPNLNATIEANIQLLLADAETPGYLLRTVQQVYASHGAHATQTRTDGEF